MAGHIAPYVGQETTIESLGKAWTLSRWTLKAWDKFLSWARTQLPDPQVVAELSCLRLAKQERPIRLRLETAEPHERAALEADLNDLMALQSEMVKRGLEKASGYLSVDSPEVQALLSSPRGAAVLLTILLTEHHPGIDEDEAFAIYQSVDRAKLKEALVVAAGKVPPAGNALAPA